MEIETKVLEKLINRAGGKEKLKKHFKSIDKWLSGEKKPTINQLEKLSDLSGIPFGDIILGKIPEPLEGLDITFYRRKSDVNPSVELEKLVRITQSRVNFASEYLKELGNEPKRFVGKLKISSNIEEAATDIKKKLKLKEDWIENNNLKTKKEVVSFLKRKLEEIGIFVFANNHFENNNNLKLDPTEFKGFSIADEYAPAIFINTNTYLSTQIFTLMHELVHIFLGNSAISDIDEKTLEVANEDIEKFCNKVAAAVLVPDEIFEGKSLDYKILKDIANKLQISPLVVILRAYEKNIITKEEYFKYLEDYKKEFNKILEEEKQKKETTKERRGGDWYRTKITQLGSRFLDLTIQAFKAREIPPNHFVFLTGIKISNIEKLERKLH